MFIVYVCIMYPNRMIENKKWVHCYKIIRMLIFT